MFLLNDLLGKNLSMPCKSTGVTGTMNEYKAECSANKYSCTRNSIDDLIKHVVLWNNEPLLLSVSS